VASETGGWHGRHVALAFALGALAGAAAALLLAPRTGAQARRKVRDTVRTARRSMDDLRGSVESSWRRAARAARNVLDDALETPHTDDPS
jgi:gas vesicle protein